MSNIKIKYFNEDYPKLEKIPQGDYVDLRVDNVKKITDSMEQDVSNCEDINSLLGSDNGLYFYKGDVIRFGLGVAMELPKGYSAIVVPRSSTFKHFGLIQTNSVGIIDNIYCGDNDEWQIEFIAMRDGSIKRHDRVCQFTIQKIQVFDFKEVDQLGNDDRGGYGTTGKHSPRVIKGGKA